MAKTPYSDRVGQKHNMLTIIKLTDKKYSGRAVKQLCLVRCDCGVEKEITIDSITSRGVISCGCAKRIHGNSALSRTYNRYQHGAKQRGYVFDLNRDFFTALVNDSCHYCGTLPSTISSYNNQSYIYNGIDRVDNSIGYTPLNVVTCCITCNRAKNNMSYDDFIEWIERLKFYVKAI